MVHGTMATLLSVKTWPQRYVSLRNNPSGTVSGWDGDPGPAGHLIFQERDGHYLISTEQWPRHFFRLVKDEFSSYLHVVGKRGEPGRAGQFVIEEMPGHFLISSKQWPDWFLFVDELGRLRAEPGDPGSKGHFLLNRKIPQESENTSLPPIIQTMYLIHNKDREHAAAMSLLGNQKEEVRAREVAVLHAQMASERAASEATLDDTRREHDDTCCALREEMERQRQTALRVLEDRDSAHGEELALREAQHASEVAALRQQLEEERKAAAAKLREVEGLHDCEATALRQLHKAELRALEVKKEAELEAALAELKRDLEAMHAAETSALRVLMEQERSSLQAVIDQKDDEHNSALNTMASAKDELFTNTVTELEQRHKAAIADLEKRHFDAMIQLASEKDTTWALNMAKTVEDKDEERREIVVALTTHFQQRQDAAKFKLPFVRRNQDSKKSLEEELDMVAEVTSNARRRQINS